jgi:hypothetical protein
MKCRNGGIRPAPITAKLWNKRGLPVMLVTCAVASVLYLLVYPLYLH